MVQLFLLLIGAPLIRRRWWVVGTLGLLWLLLGAFFFADAFIEEIRITVPYFAAPLIFDATISLGSAVLSQERRVLRITRGLVCLTIAALLIFLPHHSSFAIAMVVGAFLCVDGFWRAGSALVVRFPGWPPSFVKGVIELMLGLWSLSPWPSNYKAEVGGDVGLIIMVSAAGLLGLALQLRYMPAETTFASILSTGWPHIPSASTIRKGRPRAALRESKPLSERRTATVHVWTPTGAIPRIHHGMERYIAAVDEAGNVSTGHAALELPPSLYISHYPAEEIDRAPSEFSRILRATPDNNVKGRFQPSYGVESAEWCPSSFQVPIPYIDAAALRYFWNLYRRDDTYNLTNRNCSSGVVKALDAGLEGAFARAVRSPIFIVRLVMLPEFWAAGMLRHRASTMAWTPGLTLDYARALTVVLSLLPTPKQSVTQQP